MHIIKLSATASTNDDLRNYVKDMQPQQPTVLWTPYQFQGKGQAGNVWHSAPNENLTFSLYIPDLKLPVGQSFELNKWVSIALADWLENHNIPEIQIKWPNDILSGQKKLGGILIESSISNGQVQPHAIGVGINVNQSNFLDLPNATSMSLQTEKNFDIEKLVVSCAQAIVNVLKSPLDSCTSRYLERLYGLQKLGKFSQNGVSFEGVIEGVQTDGRLTIQTEDKQLLFAPKTLKFVHISDQSF